MGGRRGTWQLSRDASGNIVKTGISNNARNRRVYSDGLSVRHEFKVGKNDSYKVVLEGNAYNFFNQHAATSVFEFVLPTNVINPTRASRFPGDPQTDLANS